VADNVVKLAVLVKTIHFHSHISVQGLSCCCDMKGQNMLNWDICRD